VAHESIFSNGAVTGLSTPSLGITSWCVAALLVMLSFNSLSRDHRRESRQARRCIGTRLSTPSLGITGRDLPRVIEFQAPQLSTPSLGITGGRRRAALEGAEGAFNSLSRDHFGNAMRLFSSMTLSTPSLGITGNLSAQLFKQARLSTPSLGITGQNTATIQRQSHQPLSTPSLGITCSRETSMRVTLVHSLSTPSLGIT